MQIIERYKVIKLAEFIDFLTELCVGTCSKCIFKGDCEKISVLKWLQSESEG